MTKKKTLLSWSSGKDSAWTLYQLQQDEDIELLGLVTTVNQTHQRVAMHAVRVWDVATSISRKRGAKQRAGKCSGLIISFLMILRSRWNAIALRRWKRRSKTG